MNTLSLSSLLPMLMEVFGYVLRSSLLGAVAVLLVVLARWVLGARLAPAARCWLWLPVVLLCLSPQLPALFSWDAPTEAFAKPVREVLEPALGPIVVRGEPTLLVESQLPMAEVEVVTMSTREKLAIAWAAGAVSIFAFWLVAYTGLWRRVRREQGVVSELLRDEFRECVCKSGLRRAPRLLVTRAVDNPAVAGLWRPTVLMPPGLEDSLDRSSLRHVLLHELGHIRRLDLWLHWASALLVALHWFNPFVWFASRKFRADREAACDASVIHASDDQAHAYGQTLLALGSRMTPAFAPRLMAGMLGGADLVKQRIVDITRRSRNSRVAAWCTFIVVMLGTGMLAVMAAEPAAPAAPKTESKAEAEKPSPPAAAKTDPKQLYTRTFRVPPDFMAWMQEQIQKGGGTPTGSGLQPRPTAVELLKQMGVPFPEGASATYVASASQLIVRNTTDALEVIGAIVEARLNNPVRQIYVTTHLVVFKEGSKPNLLGPVLPATVGGKEAKEGATPAPDAPPIIVHPVPGTAMPFALSGVFTDPQMQVFFRALAGKGTKVPDGKPEEGNDNPSDAWQKEIARQVQAVIMMPAVTTRSGQRATIEVAREFIYPTAYDKVEGATKNDAPKMTPTAFETKPLGFILEVEPVIGEDGYTIDLTMTPQIPSLAGWKEYPVLERDKIKTPLFEQRKVTTSVSIWDGQTVVFGGESLVSPFLMDPKLKGDEATIAKNHPVMIFVTARMIDPSGNPVSQEKPGAKNGAVKPSKEAEPEGGGAATSEAKGDTFMANAVLNISSRNPQSSVDDVKVLEDFIGTQIELLKSDDLRRRAEARMKTYHPAESPVVVVLTVERQAHSGIVKVHAAGSSEPYVRHYLDCLLDELMAVRKEMFEKSAEGAMGKIIEQVLNLEHAVKDTTTRYKYATDRGDSKEVTDKLKAHLDRLLEDQKRWKAQLEAASAALKSEKKSYEIGILERPSPVK